MHLPLPAGTRSVNGNRRSGRSVARPARELARVARVSETSEQTEARRLATEARDRVRFEEDALALSDQVYRVARHLVGSREEAEDLMQETYARAFRSWRSFTPGTNLRAWLLRILTNLNIDRGRKQQRTPDTQPLEEGDYFLYNKLEASSGGNNGEKQDETTQAENDGVASAPRGGDKHSSPPLPRGSGAVSP